MPLTPAEKRKNRLKTHKVYNAYIPLFIANPFDEKLAKNRYKLYRLAKRKYGKIFEKKLKNIVKSIDKYMYTMIKYNHSKGEIPKLKKDC